ncbi:hypothetical protein BKA63DRAFT_519687 [Paraphoma chrysanthemicola]|nr:hypothetical protein BKA63DRAFT_519687 [Paraphoma chrysanthemicola]
MVQLQSIIAAPLVLLLAGLPLASAADCEGAYVPGSTESSAWAARQEYCGGALWQSTGDWDRSPGPRITFTHPGNNGQQVCWDALQNIIEQCRRNGKSKGWYSYNGSTYVMYF